MSQLTYKRIFLPILLALSIMSASAETKSGRVLMVVSSEGRDAGETRPGFEMDELSQAWQVFQDAGLKVDIASPKGGPVVADKFDKNLPFNARFLTDPVASAALADTRKIEHLKASEYDAVYVVGGKGAMFDLASDNALAVTIADIYQRNGVVGAVCHGPAALVDVRLENGIRLIHGKRITGFSNEEEILFGKRWKQEFPFLIEDAMKAYGALWQERPLMMPSLAVDGKLVTGQNPYSSYLVAEAMLQAMGIKPAHRNPAEMSAALS